MRYILDPETNPRTVNGSDIIAIVNRVIEMKLENAHPEVRERVLKQFDAPIDELWLDRHPCGFGSSVWKKVECNIVYPLFDK